MGQVANMCGNDVFKQLTENYGDELVKVVLAEKSKEVVNQKFGEFSNQSNDMFNNFENQTETIVDEKSQALKQVFESAKSKVNQTIPGGIAAIQRVKGESIKDFSGYNKLQESIDHIKDDTVAKISGKRADVMIELGSKKGDMIQNIDKQKPKIPVYDELPNPIKKQILKQGEQKFVKQIDQNKEVIAQQALKKFNPQNLKGFFGQVNPSRILEGVVGNSMGQFTKNLGGGGIGGSIGGFMDRIF